MSQFRNAGVSAKPTIVTSGTATREYGPTAMTVSVTLTGQHKDRKRAWAELQNDLRRLTESLHGIGEVETSGPRERNQQVLVPVTTPAQAGKKERSKADSDSNLAEPVMDVHVVVNTEATVTIPIDRLGDLLEVFIEQDRRFENPQFTFDNVEGPSDDLYRDAARFARLRAEAIAEGGGFSLSGVLAATCGDRQNGTRMTSALWDALNLQYNHSSARSLSMNPFRWGRRGEADDADFDDEQDVAESDPDPVLEPEVLAMLKTGVPSRTVSMTVTLTFGIAA